MTNKMKSVGEALQGFLETAVPSPLSAEERERLRLYNPTLAAQIDALDWKMFRRLSLRSLKSGVEVEALPPKLVIRLPRLRNGNGPRL